MAIALLGEGRQRRLTSWEGVSSKAWLVVWQTCRKNHELQGTLAENGLFVLLSGVRLTQIIDLGGEIFMTEICLPDTTRDPVPVLLAVRMTCQGLGIITFRRSEEGGAGAKATIRGLFGQHCC